MNLARARELGIARQLEPALRGITHVGTPRRARRRRSREEEGGALSVVDDAEAAAAGESDADASGGEDAADGEAADAAGAPCEAGAAHESDARVTLATAVAAPEPAAFDGTSLDTANWMAQLAGVLWHTPLHKLRLPGTHDSGAYALSRRHMAPSLLPRWLLRLNRRAWWLTRPLSGLVARWGEAQRLDVTAQLEAGARYLDLRIVNVQGVFHVAHGMLGATCEEVLEQVARFLDAHAGEVVLADCNHFHHFTGRADHDAFLAVVRRCLGRHLARRELRDAAHGVTLGALVAARARCVLLYGGCDFLGVATAAAAAHCWPRTQREIVSPWPRAACWADLRARLGVLDAAGASAPGFFVLQGVVTPNARLIRRGLLRRPSSLRAVAATVTPEVVRMVVCGALRARCIVLLDHIDVADVAALLAAAYAPHLLPPAPAEEEDLVHVAAADALSLGSESDAEEAAAADAELAQLDSGAWMDGAEAWADTAEAPLLAQLSALLREGHFAPGCVEPAVAEEAAARE